MRTKVLFIVMCFAAMATACNNANNPENNRA